jgi:hypothetical protein
LANLVLLELAIHKAVELRVKIVSEAVIIAQYLSHCISMILVYAWELPPKQLKVIFELQVVIEPAHFAGERDILALCIF